MLDVRPPAGAFFISLRDDYLARLADLRDAIPTILQNVFYVGPLTHQNAMLAMTRPAEHFGVKFDAQLAEEILRDLCGVRVATPQLQIICSRLYEEQRSGVIDFDLYRSLDGARGILRSFVVHQIKGMEGDAAAVSRVLKAMVTAEGTKDILSLEDISRRSALDLPATRRLVYQLRDVCRLVTSGDSYEPVRFELVHEYLTGEIWSWMSDDEIRGREINETMAREIRSWRRFRHLRLGIDRLQVFEEHAALLEPSEEALAVLLLSCVRHCRSSEVWISKVQ